MLFKLKLHRARPSSHVKTRSAWRNFHVFQGSEHLPPMTHFLRNPEKDSSANSWVKEGKDRIQEIRDQIKKSVKGFLKMRVLCHFSHVRLFATLWTVAFQSPLSMGFSVKNTRAGCHALFQWIFPTQGSKLCLLHFKRILYPSRWKVKIKVAQSCLTLQSMDYTVQGILQPRTLEWVAFPFSTGLSPPRDQIPQGNKLELLNNSRLWKGSGELKS